MSLEEWILCPVCGNKTRVRIRKDTELRNFPLYCPKCSRESLIEVRDLVYSYDNENNFYYMEVL